MEILKFFGIQPTCCKQNDYSKLEDEENGTKFLLDYNVQLRDLNDFSQYDKIFAKFTKLHNDYRSKQKFDDSILKRTMNLDTEDGKKNAFKTKLKKRSAYNANITSITEEDESETNEPIKKLTFEDNFFFRSHEIVAGSFKKQERILMRQASVDIPECPVSKVKPPKKKHRPSHSFVADETTKCPDAEATNQESIVRTGKKKRKSKLSSTKKIKKKKSKSDQFQKKVNKIHGTSVFQPNETDLKKEKVEFVKEGAANPFAKVKTAKVDIEKKLLKLESSKCTEKSILKTVEKKGKIAQMKTMFGNLATKTKEKLKKEIDTKKKIPRISEPKSLKKRKSRLSAKHQKVKKKSINGIKAFINETFTDEKIQKFNEIKKNIIQKQVTSKTPLPSKNVQKIQKLDILASKCVTIKKLNTTCVPTVAKKAPVKDFIKMNKMNTSLMNKKDAANKSVNQSSLFYPHKDEKAKHVYKALNDYAVEHLAKNQKSTAINNELTRQALDKMILKKTDTKNITRYGSTSTISTYSSLDSTISSNTSSNHEQTFKSAHSKFPGINSTYSSLMTNDKTTNESNIRWNLNGTIQGSAKSKQEPIKSAYKPNMTVNGTKTPLKKSALTASIPQYKNNQYLAVPNVKYNQPQQIKTPMKIPQIKITKTDHIDYNIEDLHSGDETDDDEEPNKPIPAWAQIDLVGKNVVAQSKSFINFTKLFKGCSDEQVDLTNIFKIQRNRFNARTSSAHWECAPVWQSEGIKGDESFRNQ